MSDFEEEQEKEEVKQLKEELENLKLNVLEFRISIDKCFE